MLASLSRLILEEFSANWAVRFANLGQRHTPYK